MIIRFFFQNGGRQPLDLLYACLDHPQRVFGGVYHFAEFGWNRCRSFNNMQVLIFNEFGLQMPIYASQMWIWGNLTPKWTALSSRRQKARHCAETRRYDRPTRVCTAHTTQILCFTMPFNVPDTLKIALHVWRSGPCLIHTFLGPSESTSKTVCLSVQPFLYDSRS